jgi:hypothetical protein
MESQKAMVPPGVGRGEPDGLSLPGIVDGGGYPFLRLFSILPIAMILPGGMIAHALLRHRLPDVRLAVRRVLYCLLILFLSGAPFLLVRLFFIRHLADRPRAVTALPGMEVGADSLPGRGNGFAVPVPGGRLSREGAFREALRAGCCPTGCCPAGYCPAVYMACHTMEEREAA